MSYILVTSPPSRSHHQGHSWFFLEMATAAATTTDTSKLYDHICETTNHGESVIPPLKSEITLLSGSWRSFSSSKLGLFLSIHFDSSISVVAMIGAIIAIDDAAATDTVLSVKERVFAANRALPVRRQRIVYRPGPRGMEALADDEALGGAGVARDGTAELDVLLAELTDEEKISLGKEV